MIIEKDGSCCLVNSNHIDLDHKIQNFMVWSTQHFRTIIASCHLLKIEDRAAHRYWHLLDSVVAAMDVLQPLRELPSAQCSTELASV